MGFNTEFHLNTGHGAFIYTILFSFNRNIPTYLVSFSNKQRQMKFFLTIYSCVINACTGVYLSTDV